MGAVKFSVEGQTIAVPQNGNLVPTNGLQGIANHSELLAYAALSYQNITNGAEINFGGLTGIVPVSGVYTTTTDKGEHFLQVVAYIPLDPNYAMFPNGKKLHKQVTERFPEGAAHSSYNY